MHIFSVYILHARKLSNAIKDYSLKAINFIFHNLHMLIYTSKRAFTIMHAQIQAYACRVINMHSNACTYKHINIHIKHKQVHIHIHASTHICTHKYTRTCTLSQT